MFMYVFSHVFFRSEPHPLMCPKCGCRMRWNPRQGPGFGGWECPRDGLKIDNKP